MRLMRQTVAASTCPAAKACGRRSAPGHGGEARRVTTGRATAMDGATAARLSRGGGETSAPTLRGALTDNTDRVRIHIRDAPARALRPAARAPRHNAGVVRACHDVT